MLQIGVTGGIGSGKSLVCSIFQSLGIPVYEADQKAKELTITNKEVRNKITESFGEISYQNNVLNKVFLAKQVFNNVEKLKILNAIIHPAVAKDFDTWKFQFNNKSYILKEAAILFESGSYQNCDKIILVDAPEIIRIKRVIKRDKTSEQEVKQRMKNQWNSEKKAGLSDFIIDNSESEALIPQVMQIHEKLLSL